jgi:hypothetical protein
MQRTLRAGDEDALAQATMLQGILSGDVIAASMHARQRLQNENLRLRRRLTHVRIKTEEAKRRLLEAETDRSQVSGEITAIQINRIREIYGLEPQRLLPPAREITAFPIPTENSEEKTTDDAPRHIFDS